MCTGQTPLREWQWGAQWGRRALHIQWSCADPHPTPAYWSHLSPFTWSSGMDDDLVCDYDSTWDTESDGDELENTGRSKKTRPAFVCHSLSLLCELLHSGIFCFIQIVRFDLGPVAFNAPCGSFYLYLCTRRTVANVITPRAARGGKCINKSLWGVIFCSWFTSNIWSCLIE